MAELLITRAGPGVTIQDTGRPGYLAQGLSRGGAADALALAEGAALLEQDSSCAAIELAGSFLSIETTAPLRIALTGALMRAISDDKVLPWHASHMLPQGAKLELSGSRGGYSYLHAGGGIDAPKILGARSAHLAAGIGRMLEPGDRLTPGTDKGRASGMALTPQQRFAGGVLRVIATPQTQLFPEDVLARFTATAFCKDARGNRMGQRLVSAAQGFALPFGLSILSEAIVPGDIQITGDGAPFVLLAECQTTGGYPRIGTVLPCDLPKLVQAPAGSELRFEFVTLDMAVAAEQAEAARRAALPRSLRPLIRDPQDIADLLSFQLISGVTSGDDLERNAV